MWQIVQINQARNDDEVIKMMLPQLKIAMEYAIQKIWNDNRELIRVMVYEAYKPEVYQRTGEFQESWETDVKSFRNVVEGELHFDPRLLTVNYDEWQHGSKALNEPMTQYLAEVIYQGLSGPIFGDGPWRRKRDVWKELNKRIGKNKLREYFEEGMKRAGISFIRRRPGIKKEEYYG